MPKPEADFKWTEELRGELQDYTFSYVIKREAPEVQQAITAGVYKTLAGHEVSAKAQNRFIAESTTIRDEETETVARGLMDQIRGILSESNGYQYEWDEAKKQGQRAAEAIKRKDTDWVYSQDYDYWAMRPVKSVIQLWTIEGYPRHLLLSCGLSELGEQMGYPATLLSRDLNAEALRKNNFQGLMLDFFQNVARGLDRDADQAVVDMFNGQQKMAFVAAMNDVGHTNFDRVRSAIVYSGDKGHPRYTSKEQWDMLSKREKAIAQRPRAERLYGNLSQALVVGTNRAILRIDYWTEGEAWYDPSDHNMKGKIDHSQHDVMYANLSPKVTPDSTHEDFLQLRRNAQELVKKLGFPERPRIIW